MLLNVLRVKGTQSTVNSCALRRFGQLSLTYLGYGVCCLQEIFEKKIKNNARDTSL